MSSADCWPLCAPSDNGSTAMATGITSRHTSALLRDVMPPLPPGAGIIGDRPSVACHVHGSRKGTEDAQRAHPFVSASRLGAGLRPASWGERTRVYESVATRSTRSRVFSLPTPARSAGPTTLPLQGVHPLRVLCDSASPC